MKQEFLTKLGDKQLQSYQNRGYYFPVRVLGESEIVVFRSHFDGLYELYSERLKTVPPSKHGSLFGHTPTFQNWVYRIVSHPKALDAVESVLGPNLLVWDSGGFAKMPGDKKYISWHQDATYWGLRPANVATAWVALSPSTRENGGLQVMPGSHKNFLLPQRDTYAPGNALSRGQEVAVEVDETQAVDINLQPGEMSLHHVAIVHGSKAKTSGITRIGIGIRCITPDVMQDGSVRQFALLVRGKDDFGHFDLIDPP